jgi:HTH-type transcriptional regulator, competence development regulator
MTKLGECLRQVREIRQQSLRGAAAAAEISAPYLQKLERGDAHHPSPAVLHRLATALDIPYSDLMELAGHLVPRQGRANSGVNVLAHAMSAENLSPDEIEALARYLAFLRHERTRGS